MEDILFTRAHEWDVRTNNDIAIQLIQKLDEVLDKNPDYLFSVSQEGGMLERAINAKFSDEVHTFMNPIFKTASRVKLCREVDRTDGKEYIVPRYSYVELVYQDSLGSVKALLLEDVSAMVIHQAMDMLDGVYPRDIGLEVIPEFDQASREEQEEVISAYLKSLDERYKAIDKELSEDEETKEKWNALKFMKGKAQEKIVDEDQAPQLSNRKKKFINKLAKQLKARDNKLKFWRKK